MGILIYALLMVGGAYFLINGIGRTCPPLGNFLFRFSKVLGPALVAFWLWYMLEKDTNGSALFMAALGLVLTLMPTKKRFV
jgi:hypothetical protein